jgi:hypothetical protein
VQEGVEEESVEQEMPAEIILAGNPGRIAKPMAGSPQRT